MEHVDAVWDRLHFRTPWSKAREHDRVRAALGRFLEWHVDNARRSSAPRPRSRRWSSCRRRAGGAHRVRRPDRARRRRRRRRGRPQDRAQQALQQVGGGRTASSASTSTPSTAAPSTSWSPGPGPAAPSSCSSALDDGQPRSCRPRPHSPRTAPRVTSCASGWVTPPPDPRRVVPGGRRARSAATAQLRADLPGQERRVGADPVTQQIPSAAELAAVMRTPYAPSPQQWAAISRRSSPRW